MADRVKFAVVGVGDFGQKRIKAIVRSGVAELLYVVDMDKEKAESTAMDIGAEALTFEELLHRSDYDVAIVAVPNRFHEPTVLRLLRAGKDVWCEKPMSMDVASARRMVEESLRTGRVLKVGSNVRYFPNVIRAADLLRRGFVGEPFLFRGWIGNDGSHLLRKEWYRDKEVIGGGTLLDNGVHLLDLIRYLVGEIRACQLCTCLNLRWRLDDLEDNCVAIYDLINGGVALVHSSWTERPGYMYFEIQGDEGYVQVDARWSRALLTYGKVGEKPVHEDHTDYPKRSYELELEDFVGDYNRGLHPRPTSYDGYRAVKIVCLSYQAAALGEPTLALDSLDEELARRFSKVFEVRQA